MKRIFVILVSLLCATSSLAQNFYVTCSYAGGSYGSGLYDSSEDAESVIDDICEVLGINAIPIFRSNVENAGAATLNNTPIIVYNSKFLNEMFDTDPWCPVSILAHEVGHHLSLDATWYGSFQHPWTKELRADYVSGFVLAKLGASQSEATAAQRSVFSWIGSDTHPDSPRRIAAIKAGWQKGNSSGDTTGGGSGGHYVPCEHPLHPNGDLSPCEHPAHYNGDVAACTHVCYNNFGAMVACHPAGDLYPCTHAAHYRGDVSPCVHPAHSEHFVKY